jgi:hypothetical protein
VGAAAWVVGVVGQTGSWGPAGRPALAAAAGATRGSTARGEAASAGGRSERTDQPKDVWSLPGFQHSAV